MKLVMKEAAVIYTFESDNGETSYRFECIDGVVTGLQSYEVQYFDDGDAENGPSLGSELSSPREMFMSQVWRESELEYRINEIIKDAEAYTLYVMQNSYNANS